MNKRGFELSINFIVTLILAMVILSFGIYFVKMIYERSTELKLVLDQQTEMELERLMDSGEKVSIYPGKSTVSSGETARFGLGILNIQDNENFKIKIEFNEAYDQDKNPIPNNNINKIEITTAETPTPNKVITESKTIKRNNKEKMLVGIKLIGAPKGTYIFNVDVCYKTNPPNVNKEPCSSIDTNYDNYDFRHKIYVTIK